MEHKMGGTIGKPVLVTKIRKAERGIKMEGNRELEDGEEFERSENH
jgi:hypothetical protein